MPHTEATIERAVRHLKKSDPVMRAVIGRVGTCRLPARRNRFQFLVGSIISQQISTAAARTIRSRLVAHFSPQRLTAERLATCEPEQLRRLGISRQKAKYLCDLATKTNDGQIRLHRLHRLSDDQVIEELTQVKGIGVWTAQMFLMFCLGRGDVLPHDDLGIRNAMRDLYDLAERPNRNQMNSIAASWRPYTTIACWYCWQSLDLAPRPD